MATTDARSGFRLPWSSDRTNDATDEQTSAATADVATPDAPTPAAEPVSETHFTVDPWTGASLEPAATDAPDAPAADPAPAAEAVASSTATDAATQTAAPAPAGPTGPARKPNKFLADLTRAMQAAAEEARNRALSPLQADAKTHVESIHARSATEAATLRRQADDDVAAVREWSKAEIARIREETEQRITDRKARLETEIDEHAAVIEREIDAVQKTVAGFEAEMAAFFERLLAEEDPTRFATMAENVPEPPTFDDFTSVAETQAEAEAVAEVASSPETPAADVDLTTEASVEAADTSDAVEAVAEAAEPAEAGTDPVEATAETVATVDPTADGQPEEAVAETEADAAEAAGIETATDPVADSAEDPEPADGSSNEPHDTPSFGSFEGYEGSVDGVDGDGEVDREAAFAAIQAAAEAAASAEVAADAAARAEAVADVAIEIIGHDGEPDPRFAALGLNPDDPAAFPDTTESGEEIPTIGDEDLATRLAGLVPGKGKTGGSDVGSTQVIVVGLVSVASIASFKRHLGRVSGVQSVGVSSGPDGEFVFAVTHGADANLRDAIPSLPSFQARVTSSTDGALHVTAHDPEADS